MRETEQLDLMTGPEQQAYRVHATEAAAAIDMPPVSDAQAENAGDLPRSSAKRVQIALMAFMVAALLATLAWIVAIGWFVLRLLSGFFH